MKVVPKRKRLAIYKEALEYYSKELFPSHGICMRLGEAAGCPWNESTIYFPEFGKFFNCNHGICGTPIKYFERFYGERSNWRIKVLKEIIKSMEK